MAMYLPRSLPMPGCPTTIMIREEYQEIMLGILRWIEHRMTAGLEKTVEAMDVDLSWLEEPPTPGNLGVVHASRPLSDM
ncbi:hypothetical protein CPB85DRAFT_1341280, partial [Mucidula mucida]